MGLHINIEKTKYMFSTAKDNANQPNSIRLGDAEFDAVKDFTYLGSTVNTENDITQEIKRRIMLANRTLYGLSRILRSKLVRRNTKIKIYKTLILPVLMYGAEAWTLSAADKTMLGVFERKILRMIYGPVCSNGEWRIQYNSELYNLYNEPDIVTRITKQQLRWLGHVHRMQEQAPPRRVAFTTSTFGGKRKAGGQKLRWLDVLEKEMRSAQIDNWRSRAVNRPVWRSIIDRL
ncbi:hypothetical protein [Streptomyces sp. IBSBF 2390]|uniref:hypothetical protein n=1 Tax=Streptomyces sp. IBSBF 2390 TaxID=2903533 RepID=UPI002FDC24D2